jgi:ABC-type sulfate transport system permease component
VTHFWTYTNFLFSLFGTITRNAGLLSTYSLHLGRTLAVQVIIDIVQLILFFSQSRQTLIQNCIDGSTDQEVKDICDNSFDASKWSIVASMIVGLLIQFCEFSFLPRHRCETSFDFI